MQHAVRALLALTPTLSDDIDFSITEQATPLLDQLTLPISIEDIRGLLSLLPAGGDTASGLNWTILHAIESSPAWPQWDLLTDTGNEWVEILLIRLHNGGIHPPGTA